MGVFVNHAIAYVSSPLFIATILLFAALLCRKRRVGKFLLAGAALWLYLMSTGLLSGIVGAHLERMYPPAAAETMPDADAIVLLGGSVIAKTNSLAYAELTTSADRVVHAARLYKAGKAQRIHVTFAQDAEFLTELGVPTNAVTIAETPRNTEEEARYIAAVLDNPDRASTPSVLLVTSAWHMRRAELMFSRYAAGVKVIPAATDYEALAGADSPFDPRCLLPSAEALLAMTCYLKEYLGYYGYLLLR